LEFIRRHQLISFFVLTYCFSWGLWLPFQPLYLSGKIIAAPFLMLGIFGPALISIVLSAIIRAGKRTGNRKSAVIAFFVVWIPALLLFVADQVTNEGRSISLLLVVISAAAAILPASVFGLSFYSGPGVRDHLATLLKPKVTRGYYLLALFLFPMIWGFGIIISSIFGIKIQMFEASPTGIGLIRAIFLAFFYNLLFTGLSEEPGWRGFALRRLQARFSPLMSSLILGVFWAVWHAPARFGGFEAKTLEDTFVEWILIVLVSIVFTWLYNQTTFSLLSTVLLHPALNVTSQFLPATIGALLLLISFPIFVIVRNRMWRKLDPAILNIPVEEHEVSSA
jgi:membrane protease YdiL (CAAX protease family)